MAERKISMERNTAETKIRLTLDLDGTGKSDVNTGCGFFDHMMTLFAKHGRFDLDLSCDGDTYVDYHHTVEDCGIVLGQAFKAALGDKRGINRYADIILPMDEALIMAAVDISGRGYLSHDIPMPAEKTGDFDTALCKAFWLAFIRASEMTLHIRMLAGENAHHIIEGVFKAVGRVLSRAAAIDQRFADEIPSTKGVL